MINLTFSADTRNRNVGLGDRADPLARHYCRNLKCRSKLPAPIENVRTPIAIPRQAWAHHEEAKRGAEKILLRRHGFRCLSAEEAPGP